MKKKGFTLLEILLVVAAIGILAGIIILALNPAKQLAETRNAQRWSDVNAILNGIWQYSIDNDGEFPTNIPNSSVCSSVTQEICVTDSICSSGTDLSDLTDSSLYLTAIPEDPTGATASFVGYAVVENPDGRILVCAPDAERGATIELKR